MGGYKMIEVQYMVYLAGRIEESPPFGGLGGKYKGI